MLGAAGAPTEPSQPAGKGPPPARKLNLLLITAEGLRPDRLSCYREAGAISTPNIDRLAADGRIFARVLAASPSTVPSIATLLTGQYPFGHHVWEDDYQNRLPDQAVTLTERLKAAGYKTAAFVATSRLARERGLGQGFDLYQDGYRGLPTGVWQLRQRPGGSIVAAAKSWMEGVGPGPFFLWTHFIDPAVQENVLIADPLPATVGSYPEQVKRFDGWVGELIDLLQDQGRYAETVVILTADHGYALGEHGELRSGVFLYDSTLRVPLLVKIAGPDPGRGGRVAGTAGTLDLFPTIERLLGLRPTAGLPGRDLLSASPASPSSYYAVALMGREVFGWSALELLARGDERLIAGAATEFYDVASDPRQEKDLASSRPDQARKLAGLRKGIGGGAKPPPAHFLREASVPAELSRSLAEKGYVAPDPAAARRRALPDARRFRGVLPILVQAYLAWSVYGAEAVGAVEERLTKEDPEGLFSLLTVALRGLGRPAEGGLERAAPLLEKAQQIYPLEPESYHLLGHLAMTQKRLDQAVVFLRASLALAPRHPGEVAYDLGCAYARQGKKGEALSQLRKGIDLGFRDSSYMAADPDLESLRGDPTFQRLLGEELPPSAGR